MVKAKPDMIKQDTSRLRSSPAPVYARIRELLRERGVDPDMSLAAVMYQDDVELEYGVIVTADRRVFEFDFDYSKGPVEEGIFRRWRDLTDSYESYYPRARRQIVAALEMLDEAAR